MSNLAYLASAAAKDKCQLYAFYFSERDYPSRVAQIPGLKVGSCCAVEQPCRCCRNLAKLCSRHQP